MSLLQELYKMSINISTGVYPAFVTKKVIGDEVPAFIYHKVDKNCFDKQLGFLQKNEYQSLHLKDFDEMIVSNKPYPEKAIFLTFDDGLENLYSVVFPLLLKYNLKAVIFISPAWIGKKDMMNWEQIKEMHESGIVDFQSHSYSHQRIPVSSKIIDFFNPKYRYYRDWQLPFWNGDSLKNKIELPLWGTPIYQNESCLSDKRKYLYDPELVSHCTDFIKNRLGANFIKNPFWRKKINKYVNHYFVNNNLEPVYESQQDQKKRIRQEIELSKEIIEKKLMGKKVVSFSYPYNERSIIADQILKEAGYRYIFGGLNKCLCYDSDNKLKFFRRVTGDFIMRLPGMGRSSLNRILLAKASRRLRAGLAY
jgi:peptidoglycan/xylan/chitin deacetylase (PgdA/CDA1 family)